MSVPIVPLSAFSNLAGASLAADLRRLMTDASLDALVLFSDSLGENVALLPIGPAQAYTRIEDLAGRVIEGLRPLCALRLRMPEAPAAAGRNEELARLEESLRNRERYLAECEQKMAELGQNLSEREAMLDQREQMLIAKEREFFRRSGEATRQTTTKSA